MTGPLPILSPTFKLETRTETNGLYHHVYWQGRPPLETSVARNCRYDCPPWKKPQFGVLYLAYELPTAWMETIVRANMIRKAGEPILIPAARIRPRWACEVQATQGLVLAEFADETLIHLGESASNVMGDSYVRTRRWAALLHAHALPAVDGLRFRSRFNSGRFCVALFERALVSGGVRASNLRSMDPAGSSEAQSIMRKFNVLPT